MKNNHFDLVILARAQPPSLLPCGAQELGKTAVMTEERTIGGTMRKSRMLAVENLIEAAKLIMMRASAYPGSRGEDRHRFSENWSNRRTMSFTGYRKKKYESLTGGKSSRSKKATSHSLTSTRCRSIAHSSPARDLMPRLSRPVIPEIEGLRNVPYLTSDLLT